MTTVRIKTVKSRLTFRSAFSIIVTVTLKKTAVAKNLSQSISLSALNIKTFPKVFDNPVNILFWGDARASPGFHYATPLIQSLSSNETDVAAAAAATAKRNVYSSFIRLYLIIMIIIIIVVIIVIIVVIIIIIIIIVVVVVVVIIVIIVIIVVIVIVI